MSDIHHCSVVLQPNNRFPLVGFKVIKQEKRTSMIDLAMTKTKNKEVQMFDVGVMEKNTRGRWFYSVSPFSDVAF